MVETVTLPPVVGRRLTRILPIRVSDDELDAFRLEAGRRKMSLSAWVRSACATFLVCGKATVLVPALPGGVLPRVVENMMREKHQTVVSEEEMETVPPEEASERPRRRDRPLVPDTLDDE